MDISKAVVLTGLLRFFQLDRTLILWNSCYPYLYLSFPGFQQLDILRMVFVFTPVYLISEPVLNRVLQNCCQLALLSYVQETNSGCQSIIVAFPALVQFAELGSFLIPSFCGIVLLFTQLCLFLSLFFFNIGIYFILKVLDLILSLKLKCLFHNPFKHNTDFKKNYC